ncbi:MAG: CidA/LrgA family protein [Candidatus Thermochlorobacter sp.]
MLIQGFAIIFLLLLFSESVVRVLSLPLPSSVIGLLLLLLCLQVGVIKLDWIKSASDILLKNLSLFFVPPGVGLMLYVDALQYHAVAMLVAWILSTFAVMATVALVQERFEKKTPKT